MPCSRGYLEEKSLDFQKQKTEEKQMKKFTKYGIALLSVAVLAATASAVTVTADDVAEDNAPAVETVAPVTAPAAETAPAAPVKEEQYVVVNHYGINEDGSRTSLSHESEAVKDGGVYTVAPKNFTGWTFDHALRNKPLGKASEVETPYQFKYGDDGGKFFHLFYKPQPDPTPQPQPDPNPTPQPSPNPTPTPTPQPKPEPEPQPDPKPAPQPGDDNKGGQAKPDDNGKGDGKAENPADNQKPADKGTAKQPEGEKPTDNSKAPDQSKKSETVKPKATEDKKEEAKNKLPNTGEAVSSLGFLGVGLLSSLGLTKKRYKGRHERH